MVSEETMNNIKNALISVAEQPMTDAARRRRYNDTVRPMLRNVDYRDEGVNKEWLDALWEEVLSVTEPDEGDVTAAEFEAAFNKNIKPYFKYNNTLLSLENLFEDNFDINSITLNVAKITGDWESTKNELDGWIRQQIGAEKIPKNVEDRLMDILEIVDEQVAREISSDELKTIELLPQDLVKGIRNMRFSENRDVMYAYWKKISKLHPKLLEAIRDLQQEVQEGGESEVEQLILQLPNQALIGAPKSVAQGKTQFTDPFEESKRMEGESEEDFKIRTEQPKRRVSSEEILYLPNYIQEVPGKRIQMMKIGKRLGDWVATMLIAYESEHDIKGPPLPTQSRNYPNLTEASRMQRGAEKTPDDYSERSAVPSSEWWGGHSLVDRTRKNPIHGKIETERQPLHNLDADERQEALGGKDGMEYVDPIYFDSLQDGLPIPIKSFELEKAEEFVNNVIALTEKRGQNPLGQGLKKQLLRLKKEALKTKGSTSKFYIPMTSWVAENYTEKTNDVDEVNKYTSLFFKKLSDIMLEAKGQEQIQLDTNWPPQGKEAGTKTPLSAGPAKPGDYMKKPKGPGLKRQRAQPGQKAIKRTNLGSTTIVEKIQKVMDIVDDYYFVPILGKTSLFIDGELPKFSEDLTGTYNFNALGSLFSNNAATKKSANISAKLESNLNLEDLTVIAANLKAEITAEKEPDTNKYLIKLNKLAKSLSTWSGDKQRSGEFCADQLHRYLLGKEEENEISEYSINGDSAKVLYDGWTKGNTTKVGDLDEEVSVENSSIILDLRTWLEGARFSSMIQQWADMGINVDKYNKAKDEILDATDESTLNNIPELLEKMLEVHDFVRKMKGRDIIYDRLSINNIDAMDYIITKMETKHNLDITANDVSNIVYSDNSFKKISTNYGFSEDIVYEIKGMFR